MKIKFIALVISLFFLFGCITNEVQTDSNFIDFQDGNNYLNENISGGGGVEEKYPFTTQNLMSIIYTDVDYSDFNLVYPQFEPKLKSYVSFSREDYLKLREVWIADESKKVFVPIIDKLELTKDTYFVELYDLKGATGLVSILDMNKKTSLKIISVIKMNAGV